MPAKLVAMIRRANTRCGIWFRKLGVPNDGFADSNIHGPEIYRSDDAGATWQRANTQVLRDVNFTYGYYFGQGARRPPTPSTSTPRACR